MENKPNTKCVECGKTYYSLSGAFHKEEDKEFYETICSKECGRKQGLSEEELSLEE